MFFSSFWFNVSQIDIKDFCNNNKENTKYELISFINEEFKPFNKSTKENKWYKYDSDKDKKDNNFSIPKSINFPNLLIYKQIKK